MKPFRELSGQQGFTYVIALFLVAILSVATLAALERTVTNDRRDKEAQLLYAGQAYRTAIQNYYQSHNSYPTDLGSLLEDTTGMTTLRRYLRRQYFDPMTGSPNWMPVMDKSNTYITGVYSQSSLQPIKSAGFPPDLVDPQQQSQNCALVTNPNFICARTYQDWKFVYTPSQ
jgi:type II secretory pathway pseudopilin PulG